MEILLDCALVNLESFHTSLALGFKFPKWYGRNLDALYDCLTGVGEEATLILRHFDVLEQRLGEVGPRLRATLEEAAEENPRLELIFED